MAFKQAELRTTVALTNRALDIPDLVAEPLVAAHLATALDAAERRLKEYVPKA